MLEQVANAMSLRWAHVSRDMVYITASEAYCAWLNVTLDQITHQPVKDIVGESAVEKLSPLWKRVLKGEQVTFNDYVQFRNGSGNSYVRATYIPISDKDDVQSFCVFFLDLTEDTKTIKTLRNLHNITADSDTDLHEKIQNVLKLGVEVFDLPLALVSHIVGDKYIVKYAQTPDGAVSPGDEFELGVTYCIHTLKANGPTAFDHAGESVIKSHPCYEAFGLESYIGTPLIVDGQRYGTLNFSGPDIHEQRFTKNDYELIRLFSQWIGNELTQLRVRRDFARNQNLLTAMSQQARIGAWEVDLVKGSIYWSDMTKEIHEVGPDFVPNMETAINFYKEGYSRDRITEAVEKGIATGEPWDEELQIVTGKGNEIWVAALGRAEYENGECVRLFGSFQDIDQRVKNQLELKRAKEDAEAAAKSKSEFLANMSHEIRTPMNGVLGMLHTIQRSDLTDKQARQLKIAHDSAQSLLSLINDILDFSKVDAGRLELEIINFNLEELFSSYLESVMPQLNDKKLELQVSLDSIKGLWVKGDPGRLRQVLSNLVGNAIKFTEVGSIAVEVGINEVAPDIELTCTIKDTGIGIEQSKQKALFDVFTQADASTTRKYGGTGLGLAIVKQLCSLMDGKLELESQVGKGSTFRFTAMLTEADTDETLHKINHPDQAILPFDSNSKILLVEDNVINQEVAKDLLQEMGLVVDVAENGVEAIDAIKKTEDGPYDVILMDCQMPQMDGYEATAEIRNGSAGEKSKQIPIIALTANAMKGDKEKCLKAGMDGYLSKPIDIYELQSALEVYLSYEK